MRQWTRCSLTEENHKANQKAIENHGPGKGSGEIKNCSMTPNTHPKASDAGKKTEGDCSQKLAKEKAHFDILFFSVGDWAVCGTGGWGFGAGATLSLADNFFTGVISTGVFTDGSFRLGSFIVFWLAFISEKSPFLTLGAI